jgi:type II secretory pathway component PulM
VVLLGLLLIEAGVWRLTQRILPSTRKYLALRAEVDLFMKEMRGLNALAVRLKTSGATEIQTAIQESLNALHASVDRMAEVAGEEWKG